MLNQSRVLEFFRIVAIYEANGTNISDIPTSSLPYLFEPTIWKVLDPESCLKVFACLAIIIGGILGNFGVILIVSTTKSLRTTMNFYMVNLAIADAMVCLFCVIPCAIDVITESVYIWGNFMCKFSPFTQMTCLICSVLTLSAMTWNRFRKISSPFFKIKNKIRISWRITIIWIISMVISSPLLVLKKTKTIQWSDFNETTCIENWPQEYKYLRVTYYLIICVALFFIPAVIMIISNSMILHAVWARNIIWNVTEDDKREYSRQKKTATVGVSIMTFAFILCWTPTLTTLLYGLYGPRSYSMPQWYGKFQWFSFFMAYSNSFMNPIIYSTYNRKFQKHFCLLIRCDSHRKSINESVRSSFTHTTNLILSISRQLSRPLSGTSQTSSSNKEMCQYVPNSCIPRVKVSQM